MNDRETVPASAQGGPSRRTGAVLNGLRAAVFLAPRWRGRAVNAWVLLVLVVLRVGFEIGFQRLVISGPARFDLTAWGTGWAATLCAIAACAFVARRRTDTSAQADGTSLFAWLLVADLVIALPISAAAWAVQRGWIGLPESTLYVAGWGLFTVYLAWLIAAAATLLCRPLSTVGARLGVVGLLALQTAALVALPRNASWIAVVPDPKPAVVAAAPRAASAPTPEMVEEAEEEEARPVFLTQERLESQSRAVVSALDAVLPQRPGVTDLYAITFAPYADEDVFSRETAMVAGVMRDRFDATGRVLNLQNHARTVADVPWATPLNLERAIHRMGQRMDPAEDVLFLHLTSHGGRDGRLSAGFEPIWVNPVTPQLLSRWLDEAGVRYAVISISACFSGSWIKPLAGPGRLVMTAADATHTSYGCGRRSPLTFFGRAMYDEQLRKVRSFEAAFAAALPVIDRREKEAGKSDGPSNPQISVGAAVRPRLAALVQRLDTAPAPASAPAH